MLNANVMKYVDKIVLVLVVVQRNTSMLGNLTVTVGGMGH